MESLAELAKSRLFDLTRRVEVIGGQSPSESKAGRPTLLVTPGDTVDNKYQIQALLGEGGMGAVFKARHLNLAKDVALKTFRMVEIDRSAWLRFKREAQAMARLAHPNIVQVFDFGITESNMPYYTMEYLQGESLAERTARGGNGRLNDTLRIFVEAAKALEAAHRKGIVHRDVKPANIFLLGDGRDVKVVDFGIAGLVSEAADAQKLTTTGSVFGSPLYMSPEQAMGDKTGPPSDIYSFGCALFETLCGRVPFRGENAFATMLMHQTQPPPALELASREELPEDLGRLMEKLLAKNPEQRPQSFDLVVKNLEAIIQGKKTAIPIKTQTGKRREEEEEEEKKEKELEVKSAHGKQAIQPFAVSAIVLLALISAGFLIMSQTHAPAKLQEKFSRPPYYQGLRGKEKVFKFPDGVDIGRIISENPDLPGTKPRKYKAEGELLLPTTGKLSLEISSDVRQHPEYMDGFRDNDLFRLNLKHARNEVMDHITQLSGLKTLVLVDSEIDDSKAAELGRLGGVVRLEAQRSKFTAHTYENLPYLSQFPSTNCRGLLSCESLTTLPSMIKA